MLMQLFTIKFLGYDMLNYIYNGLKIFRTFIFNLNINGPKKAKRWKATWATKAQVEVAPSPLSLWGGGANPTRGGSGTPPLGWRTKGDSFPLGGCPLPPLQPIYTRGFCLLDNTSFGASSSSSSTSSGWS
jgi:hypothetical protein